MKDSVAIFDIGSARTKLLIAKRHSNGLIEFQRFKQETGIANQINTEGILSKQSIATLLRAVSELAQNTKENGCEIMLSFTTEALRTAKNLEEIIQTIKPIIGRPHILTPQLEGFLFYTSFTSQWSLSDAIVCDIGGGSVQMSWGADPKDSVSIPIGTYTLEKQFQKSEQPPDKNQYDAMRSCVRSALSALLPPGLHRSQIVFGSTCMAEFITSAIKHASMSVLSRSENGLLSIDSNEVAKLLHTIEGKPYDRLDQYYPKNPKFMYGADKTLLIVLTLTELVRGETLIPTDESISTGIARMVLSGIDITSFGLQTV